MFKYATIKRLADLFIASAALIATSPLILGGALLVRLTAPGPVFYRAKRAGLRGKPFDMYKLRTMRVGTDTSNRRITAAEDDRITTVGKVLRRFKIDELPQLWNVLRGDMSIVGPRPEDWDIVEQHYTPEQRRILEIRPGIASPVDVHWYPDLTFHDPPPPGVAIQEWYLRRHLPIQVAEGIRYGEKQCLRLDAQVFWSTVACVALSAWRSPRKRPLPAEQWRLGSFGRSGGGLEQGE
jgi:lipopolysaccharide/colanic/teichoic acid biosynthesis glycosyltransferase